LLISAAVLLSGCGGPTMAPVKGRVVCHGKPVGAAAVVFSPVPKAETDRESGKPGTGYSESDGTFVLSTFKVRDGALIGPHRVTISLEETNPAKCKRVTKLVKDVKVGDNDIELDLTPEAGGR
jgi:hypothetical protein